jgi:hypothetical protein
LSTEVNDYPTPGTDRLPPPRSAGMAMEGRWRSRVFELVAVLLIAVLLIPQLFLVPITGLADNGDFARIMGYFGLDFLTDDRGDRYFNYATRLFLVNQPQWHSGYVSSASIFLAAALYIHSLTPAQSVFDIRLLSLLYTLILLAAVWLILVASRIFASPVRFALALMLILFCTDIGFVGYFNSFYSESISFLFLIALVGALLALIGSSRNSLLMYGAFFAFSAFFISAKPQNAPLGVLIAVFIAILAIFSLTRGRTLVVCGAALFISIFSVSYYRITPVWMVTINTYHVVFIDILGFSPEPTADMRTLGINPVLAPLVGVNAYDPRLTPHEENLKSLFHGRITYADVALFYFSRPSRLIEAARRAAQSSFINRPPYLGNFEKAAGQPPRAMTRAFSIWSDAVHILIPKTLESILALFAANLIVIVDQIRQLRSTRLRCFPLLHSLLLSMAALQFMGTVVGAGSFDLQKTLFLFNVLMQICLIVCLLWLGSRLWQIWYAVPGQRWRHIPERGSNA